MHNPAHVIQGTTSEAAFVDLQHWSNRPSMTSEIAAYGCSWTENRYVKTKQEYLHGELSSAHDLSAKCMYLQRKSRSHGVYRVGDGACSIHCVCGATGMVGHCSNPMRARSSAMHSGEPLKYLHPDCRAFN